MSLNRWRVIAHTLVLLVVFAGKAVLADSRIIGGQDAGRTEWPWAVALVSKKVFPYDGQFCGGTLIKSDWVVTAAHCLPGETIKTFDVIAKIYDLTEDNGQRVSVKRIIVHPGYSDDSKDNDIALLQLAKPVLNAKVLSLVNGTSSLVDVQATAVGWGTLGEGEDNRPGALQEVVVPIKSDAACRRAYGDDVITSSMMCAGYSNGKRDTCQGDSGGPLVVKQAGKWVLAGVTSWGKGCGRAGYYGVYTRVSKFTNFIKQKMATNSTPVTSKRVSLLKQRLDSDAAEQFEQWHQQCWVVQADCADVNEDGLVTQDDYIEFRASLVLDDTD